MKADARFQEFLKEIDDHFVYVLRERLRWTVLEQPEFTVGDGNVVLRFKTADGLFIFRVPQYGQEQLRRVALAYRIFGTTGLMPELVYQDGKCVLERHAGGVPLSAATGDAALVALAHDLGRLHFAQAEKFGLLSHGVTGLYEDAVAYYARDPLPADERYQDEGESLSDQELSDFAALRERAATPPAALMQAPRVVGHGDMWRGNILIGPRGITFIDWDRIGAYPREHDFIFLVDADLDRRQKDLVLANYPFPLEPALLDWYSLRRVAEHRRMGRRDKLALARRHGLMDGLAEPARAP